MLQRVALGLSNGEIATAMQTTRADVAATRNTASAKIGARTRVCVVRYAIARGWMAGP